MNVVYFSPRTGSTYTAKKIAQQKNLNYAGEIFFSGIFPQYESLYKTYLNTLLTSMDQYKDCVVKINPLHINKLCTRHNISREMFFRLLNPHADKNYFCVRDNIAEQIKSFYALLMLHSTKHKNQSFEQFAHSSWKDSVHVPHNNKVLALAKNLVKSDLEVLSAFYNKLPQNKKELLVYEDWADSNDKYKRDMTFDTEDFGVDYKLSDFFDVRR